MNQILETWKAFEERFKVTDSRISLCSDGSGHYDFEAFDGRWVYNFWPFGQLLIFFRVTDKQEMLDACFEAEKS